MHRQNWAPSAEHIELSLDHRPSIFALGPAGAKALSRQSSKSPKESSNDRIKVNTQNTYAHIESRQARAEGSLPFYSATRKEPFLVADGCTSTRSQTFTLVSPVRFVQCYMLALCIGLEISAG